MITSVVLLILVILTVVFLHRGFPGSVKDLGWKMSGTWSNPDQTFHIMMYSTGPELRGHVVWSNDAQAKTALGLLVIKGLIQPFGMWTSGTFVEPETRTEKHVRLKLKSKETLVVHFPGNDSPEEWRLVRSM